MGFMIGAHAPKRRAQPYLEYNAGGWHELWQYICERCGDILSEKDQEKGAFNDGYAITPRKAKAIYERIEADLKSMPARPRKYDFSRDDLRELVEFMRDSGGFEIW